MALRVLDQAGHAEGSQCVRCKSFLPALDPVIQQAYLGKCNSWEYPFTWELPLHGYVQCERFEDSGEVYALPGAAAAAEVAAEEADEAVELTFYYSSGAKSGEQYPCDVEAALHLVDKLKAAGVAATAEDLAGVSDVFPIYHKAVSGPEASVRAVFGTKGALEEDFGRTVPALAVRKGTDRYPFEVYPRMDAKENRLVGVEEALQNFLGAGSGGGSEVEEM